MPELITGLPLHPLIVHFVVVLLPIASLGAILTAVWPAVRRRFGWLTVAAAAVATALVPVATTSGENLETGLGGGNPLIDRHQELADIMIWWALGLTVSVAALMIVHTMSERQTRTPAAPEIDDGGGSVATETMTATKRSTGLTVALVVAMLATVGLSIGTGIHIYRVGDAGARTVWQDVGENLK
ncbi:DUF2231 domain-containing protein [Actinophytocola sp.]|uniref:DUF2231 domain-containing protein n=1 Tax=Actinophytocola sp. TaxID=1872138 RepID=UPI003D6C0F4D